MHHTENRGHMGNSGNTGTYDQDAVLRARVLLLGSGRRTLTEEVGAYRVLAEVSPRAYLPKLAGALVSWGYADELRDRPEVRTALHAEAAAAARRIGAGEPNRAEVLRRTLGAYERGLFALGRRAEGRAVCEELAGAGAPGRLAVVLAEEGRHAEAAELCGRAARTVEPWSRFWSMAEWSAELDAAGRREEAVEVFAELVAGTRRSAAAGDMPLGSLVTELLHLSGLLDAAGRGAAAREARQEALVVLDALVRTGEAKTWGSALAPWLVLLQLSGRPAEPAATPEAPMPSFGTYHVHGWSPDVREAYLASLPGLERETEALRADGRLPELLAAHRRLIRRAALRWESRTWQVEDPLRPLFDEGVVLARRLPDDRRALPEALTDRAAFLVATRHHAEARADLVEAVDLLDRS
ncbi:hypothetical protein ACIRTB_26475 [Streptomyces sp. NPDC101158]|uniref:hypothetical protein n=1 Tax=Streptomyces sp. NPDC101158 TaxID=3366117 RepID=UPI00380A1B51